LRIRGGEIHRRVAACDQHHERRELHHRREN
jgi:hypothetical protein